MDAAAELGRNPVSKHHIFNLSMGMSRLKRAGTAEPASRDQILRRERVQGNIHFPCSADHEQDWQPYPVDPYSCYMCDHAYTFCTGFSYDTTVVYILYSKSYRSTRYTVFQCSMLSCICYVQGTTACTDSAISVEKQREAKRPEHA